MFDVFITFLLFSLVLSSMNSQIFYLLSLVLRPPLHWRFEILECWGPSNGSGLPTPHLGQGVRSLWHQETHRKGKIHSKNIDYHGGGRPTTDHILSPGVRWAGDGRSVLLGLSRYKQGRRAVLCQAIHPSSTVSRSEVQAPIFPEFPLLSTLKYWKYFSNTFHILPAETLLRLGFT